jgi:predicted transcriptional regulator
MLTPLELDIMKAVWRQPPVTVRDVQENIRPSRNLAYTTVLTLMDRLYQKGFLTRTLQSRAHYYAPAIDYTEVREEAVNALLQSFFDGSKERLQEFLNGDSTVPEPRLDVEPAAHPALDDTLL